jgi:choline dehydrogenase-like flavoprotein
LTAEDIQKFVDGQILVANALKEVGAGHLIPFDYRELPPPGIRGGYHHMGTTRMSVMPKDGVVNSDCRVHGTDNLYVAGSSVFATCGYANPTFTIGALALRLADHLSQES